MIITEIFNFMFMILQFFQISIYIPSIFNFILSPSKNESVFKNQLNFFYQKKVVTKWIQHLKCVQREIEKNGAETF